LSIWRTAPLNIIVKIISLEYKMNYTTLTPAFADSAMTPRLILRHRGQTPRLPSRESLGHARLFLSDQPSIERRSYQINAASRGVVVRSWHTVYLIHCVPVIIFTPRSGKKHREKIKARRRWEYKILFVLP